MIIQNCIIVILISAPPCVKLVATPNYRKNIKGLDNIAAFGDAHHRGFKWYHDTSSSSDSSDSRIKTASSDSSSTSISSESTDSSSSSSASSKETHERIRAKAVDRTCNPCPYDMMKKHTNKGIKWICGGYQRARRSFKSECMMRYRNCQDGTMFVKLSDYRCKNDTYHGRHWFYDYRVK